MGKNMPSNTLKSIQTALNLVDSKKENLRKTFEELQLNSSSLSSFSFTWDEIESYIVSIQSDLVQKFSVLQEQQSSKMRQPRNLKRFSSESLPARPELKTLCENMDGLGLRKYVLDRPKERTAIRVELADALKHARDPSSLILDALDGFCGGGTDSSSGSEQGAMRRVCVVLLEEFMGIEVEIGEDVKNRAKVIAAEWMAKTSTFSEGNNGDGGEDDERREEIGALEKLGFLQLLAAYKLVNDGGYDVDALINYIAAIAKYRQAVELCQVVGLESRVSDIVQKLILKDKQLLALKFIFEYELTDEFPPVPLLKAYVMSSEKLAQKVRQGGKGSRQSMNDAALQEINALKAVIKCIDDHNLESQYPKPALLRRIEKLEKEKTDRKRSSASSAPKPQQQLKRSLQNGNKRMKAAAGPPASKRKVSARALAHPPSQPSSMQRAGLLPDLTVPYLSASAGAYGVAGSFAAAAPYASSSSGLYGMPGAAPLGLNQTASSSYPPEPHAQQHVQPGYYDGAIGYGGYNMPSQYHPVYYPQ